MNFKLNCKAFVPKAKQHTYIQKQILKLNAKPYIPKCKQTITPIPIVPICPIERIASTNPRLPKFNKCIYEKQIKYYSDWTRSIRIIVYKSNCRIITNILRDGSKYKFKVDNAGIINSNYVNNVDKNIDDKVNVIREYSIRHYPNNKYSYRLIKFYNNKRIKIYRDRNGNIKSH